MKGFLLAVAALHVSFMLAELFPVPIPFVLRRTQEKLPDVDKLNSRQLSVVGTIIRNVGIYNGIVAGGLFYAAYLGEPAKDVARVFLIGAAGAGTFGTITLRSWLPALQGVLGLIGCYLLR